MELGRLGEQAPGSGVAVAASESSQRPGVDEAGRGLAA
jgi:hypothetical protein